MFGDLVCCFVNCTLGDPRLGDRISEAEVEE